MTEKIVRNLLRTGCDVTVYGEGWEEFEPAEEEKGRLHSIGGQAGFRFEELLDIMGNSKIILQNQIRHPEGLTMVFMCAMANGAAVLADRHPILEESFGDEALLFYDNEKLDVASVRDAALGPDADKLQAIAEKGKAKAQRMGDFQAFVQSMLP